MNAVEKVNRENMKDNLPEFSVGDTVRADLLIVEGGKERVQSFTGTVLAVNGAGINRTITLRRVSYGQGIERVLPIHSPRLSKLQVVRRGDVHRGKLYYLRDQVGRASQVNELRTPKANRGR